MHLHSLISVLPGSLILIGYIVNSNTFPQPLSAEEEQIMLERHKCGDEEAKNILIEKNLRLVAHIVKKYSTVNNSADDLISIGTIGLIKSIVTFNCDKGIRLATYAARCIENEILMYLRTVKKYQNDVSLQDPIGIDKEGNSIALIDIIGSDTDSIVEKVEYKNQVKKLRDNIGSVLFGREKTIIELRYGLCDGITKTQREIAKLLNISRSYVSRIEKKAIKKLSKEFNVAYKS